MIFVFPPTWEQTLISTILYTRLSFSCCVSFIRHYAFSLFTCCFCPWGPFFFDRLRTCQHHPAASLKSHPGSHAPNIQIGGFDSSGFLTSVLATCLQKAVVQSAWCCQRVGLWRRETDRGYDLSRASLMTCSHWCTAAGNTVSLWQEIKENDYFRYISRLHLCFLPCSCTWSILPPADQWNNVKTFAKALSFTHYSTLEAKLRSQTKHIFTLRRQKEILMLWLTVRFNRYGKCMCHKTKNNELTVAIKL